MDIKEALWSEHSKGNTLKIVEYIGDNPDKFSELMTIFFSNDVRMTQRASWVMNFCADRNPQLIRPYIARMTSLLGASVHDAVKRNIVRVFQFADLPIEYHGLIIDHCFKLLTDRKAAIAIRAFSISVIDRFLILYPEIQNEFISVLEEEYEYTTTAFKSRAKKILKRVSKEGKNRL